MDLAQVVSRGPLTAEGRVQNQATTDGMTNTGVTVVPHVILSLVKRDLRNSIAKLIFFVMKGPRTAALRLFVQPQ